MAFLMKVYMKQPPEFAAQGNMAKLSSAKDTLWLETIPSSLIWEI